MTLSGKLDRKALPAPAVSAYGTREYEAPEGELEETLARIWQSLLNLERVGRHDNFFELGGHSIAGMYLLAQVAEQLDVDLTVATIFARPTIAQLAQEVSAIQTSSRPVPKPELEEGMI